MRYSRSFLIDGNLISVPDDEFDYFVDDLLNRGYNPEDVQEVDSYNVNGETVNVPQNEVGQFEQQLADRGMTARKQRGLADDAGQTQFYDDEDLRQYYQMRQQGFSPSRSQFQRLGVDENYGRSKEDREKFADWLGGIYGEDLEAPDVNYGRERNFGDAVMDAANAIATSPTVAGAVGAAKGFYEGAVGNPGEAIDDFYGNESVVGNALKGSQDFANKLTKKIMSLEPAAKEVIAQALGGESTDVGKWLRQDAQQDRVTLEENLPTDTAYVDGRLEGANEFIGDTLSTVGTFAIPGAAAVDISANTANAYYDAYERALKSGQPERKAEALATAKAGATAAMGLVLGKAAKGARSAEGFRGALADMAVTGGEMGALGGVNKIINQGIEQNYNADAYRRDGSLKGTGYLGVLRDRNGKDVTEYSVGVNIDGKEMDIPTLVPTLTEEEVQQVLDSASNGEMPPNNVIRKAVDFARSRIAEGKSVWANDGSRDIDWSEVAAEAGKQMLEGAGFAGISRVAHGLANRGQRSIYAEARRTAQKRAEEEQKDINRIKAEARYNAKLSDEALNDIDNSVNDMIKTEVIPSYRHAEEVRQRAIEKLGNRESGESHEAVEQAVMEAAYEVQERLNTPERVTNAALERRQTEAKMRENEAKARAAEDYYAEEAKANEAERNAELERQGAAINADLDAQRAAYEKREKDIKAAFERGDGEAVKQLIEEQKAEMDAYLKAEAERKRIESESEKEEPVAKTDRNSPTENHEPQYPTRDNRRQFSPEYDEWLKKSGRVDSDKNWNRFIAENDLPEDWKMRDEAKDARIDEQRAENAEAEEMGNRIETAGERQRSNAEAEEQSAYDELMTAREKNRAIAGRKKREGEVAADWEAAEKDKVEREREKTRKAAEAKKSLKESLEEYERAEMERKRREAEEDATLQPQEFSIRVSNETEGEATNLRDSPEYAEWLQKSGRNDTDKNWNKYVMENELDPSLRVERNKDVDREKIANNAERNYNIEQDVQGAIDEIGRRINERDAAEAQGEVDAARRDNRQNDIEAAFAEYDKALAERAEAEAKAKEEVEAMKKGQPVKNRTEVPPEPQTPEAIRDAVKDDPVLQKLDAAYRKAKNDTERNALKEQFKARVQELQGKRQPVKPTVEQPVEQSKTDSEVSKTDTTENADTESIATKNEKVSQTEKTEQNATKEEDAKILAIINDRRMKNGQRKLSGFAANKAIAEYKEDKLLDKFIENEVPGGVFAYLQQGGLLPTNSGKRRVTDFISKETKFVHNDVTWGDALDSFFDGMPEADRRLWQRRLYGTGKLARVRDINSISRYGGDEAIDALREYFHDDNLQPNEVLDMLNKEYNKFYKFKERGGKTSEELHYEELAAEEAAREVKIDGDSFDIEELKAKGESDEQYDNAIVEVSQADKGGTYTRQFGADQLNRVKKNDILRFDHSDSEWIVDTPFDSKTKEIVVSADIEDNPLFSEQEKAEMRGRRFKLTAGGKFIELKERENGTKSKNEKGATEIVGGNGNGGETIGKSGKGFAPKPTAVDEAKPALTAKDAAKILGNDAYNKTELAKKLAQWEKHPTEQNAKHREAAKVMLKQLEGAKKEAPAEDLQQISDTPIAMRANAPERRGRAEVLDWAKKNGRNIINGMVTPDAMREYDAQMAQKSAKAVKRLFPDMKINYYDKDPKMGGEGKRIEMRNKHGQSLGWFYPQTKEVVLLPGADAETVAHEIGWHGVRDWAKRYSPTLFNKMREVENNVDPELRTKVLRLYRTETGYNRDDLLNEFGAWTFMGRGGKALEEVVSSREGAKWYASMLNAAKDIYKDYATKRGGNRIDLSKIDNMDGEQLMDYIAKEMAGGKTLGNIGAPGTGKKISTKESAKDVAKRKIYDIGAVFRSIEKDVEKKTGNKIRPEDSVDQAFALRPGLQEAANLRFKGKTDALKKAYAEYGVSHDDFAYYMACKAAMGRDAKIDAKNIKALEQQAYNEIVTEFNASNRGREVTSSSDAFKDAVRDRAVSLTNAYKSSNGSNINPQEAAKTIREWESGDMADKTAALRKQWRELINETIDRQVEAGLVSREQAEQWKSEEPDYVPFKSPIDEASGEYFGRGTNLTQPEHYEAKGRNTAAGNVLTHALVDWQATEKRAIENEARQKLANLIEQNPELGTVEKMGRNKVVEQRTKDGKGEVGADPNVLTFKRDGDTYVIRMNGERGAAMAAAFTGRNLSRFGDKGVTLPQWMGGKKVTIKDAARVWSSFATEWSPTFAIRNTIKDNIELANIVFSEMGPVKGAKFAANYAKGQAVNAKDVWQFARDGKVKEGSELAKFIEDGGLIGGFKNEGYGDINEQFSGKSIEQLMKSGDNKSSAIRRYSLDLIGSVTKMSELQTRVNAYQAAKAVGMSGKEAALWSRRAVTDFNRKGENTGVTNTLRMFSNSTTGATARGIAALTKSKYGMMAAASYIGYGYLEAMLEEAMNADEDEKAKKTGTGSGKDVTEYDRQNSALLIRSGGKEYRIPAHESPFSMLKYFGGCLRRVQNGTMTKEQMAKEMGLSVATLASHLSGWGDINFDNSQDSSIGGVVKSAFASGVPSFAQPFMEVMLNIDYAGREVYRGEFPEETTPRSERGRENTPEVFKTAVRYLNKMSGGNEARRGWLDIHPESLQKIVEGIGKNALKDVVTAYATFSALLNGEMPDLDVKNTIVKRDFVRDAPDSTSRYYDAKREYKMDADEFGKRKFGSYAEKQQYLNKHPALRKKAQLDDIKNRIDELRKKEANQVKDGRRYVDRKVPFSKEEIEKFKARRLELQARFIEILKN